MRYHTTAKDIAVSILVVLSCTAICLYGILVFQIGNPAQPLADFILGKFDRGGEVSITAGNLDRGFFREIELDKVTVSDSGATPFTAESLVVKEPLQTVLLSLFQGTRTFSLEAQNPVLDMALPNLTFSFQGSSGTNRLLASWLDRNSLSITMNSLRADISLPQLETNLGNADIALKLGNNLSFISLSAVIDELSLANANDSFQAKNITLSLDKQLQLQMLAQSATSDFADSAIAFSKLVIRSKLPSFNLSQSVAVFDVSLGALVLARDEGIFTVPSLSGKLTLEKAKPSLGEASFDSLRFENKDYQLTVPTSSANVKFLDDSMLFGFGTKPGETITFVKTGEEPVVSNSLQGSAELQDDGRQYAQLSLRELETSLYGWKVSLDNIQISAQGLADGEGYQSLELALGTGTSLFWDKQDISLASPLSVSLRFTDNFSKFSSSIDLSSLTTNLAEGSFSLSIGYQNDFGQQQIQTELTYGDQLSMYALYDLPSSRKGTLSLDSRLQNLDINAFQMVIDTYAPFLNPYLSEDSLLTGNLSFQSTQGKGKLFGFDGTFSADLALEGLSLGNRTLNAGSTLLAHIDEDTVGIDSMTLTTSGYRMLFKGTTVIGTWLPSGDLSLSNVADGSTLFSVGFSPLPPDKYRFSITTPMMESFAIDGSIEQGKVGTVSSQATVSLLDKRYPMDIYFSANTLDFNLQSENKLSVTASFIPPVSVQITSDNLPIPTIPFLDDSLLTGDISLIINNLNDWQLLSNKIIIEPLFLFGKPYSLSGSLAAIPTNIKIDALSLSDGATDFAGKFLYQGTGIIENVRARLMKPFTLSFAMEDAEKQRVGIALSSEGERVEGITNIESLDLERLHPQLAGLLFNASFVGFTDFSRILDLDGNLTLSSTDAWNKPLSAKTDIIAKNNLLSLDNATITYGESSIEDFTLSLDTKKGLISSLGRFVSVKHLVYKDQDSHFNYAFDLGFAPADSLFELSGAIKTIRDDKLTATLSITDILVLGEKGISDGDYRLSYQDGQLGVDSSLVRLGYDLQTNSFSASLDKRLGVGGDFSGTLDQENIYIEANNIFFPLPLLNRLFPKPILTFLEGNIEGDMLLIGPSASPKVYGQLFMDNAKLQIFWLPKDIVSAKNVTASFNGERGTTPFFPFFSTNLTTGETVQGKGKLSAFLNGLSISNYQINATTDSGSVFVWLPMLDIDADIKAFASGDFELSGVGYETWISGDILIENASMSIGIKDLPPWYIAAHMTSTDFNITTGKNVSFFYPNPINPIINATINENQKLAFLYDHKNKVFDLDGVFSFRSGEIFYFQKNFFITEGSLSLHTDALSGQDGIQPKINLRAKMADFDTSGNRVDIYLVLRESTLTNLNPTFESVPNKDINEILEILGQSILPTGAYGQVNLSSVASLAVAATDVAERLGLITNSSTTDLTEIIRISLGLDMFSLRSNIVQNVLIEALPGSTYSSTSSPLARYLNNTTMFMGKYIGNNSFLQALLHLTAMDSSKVTRSFLVPDLSLDLELSLEWNNPLSTFSLFTQPNELSVYNILDTIGFSVTRRIVLR